MVSRTCSICGSWLDGHRADATCRRRFARRPPWVVLWRQHKRSPSRRHGGRRGEPGAVPEGRCEMGGVYIGGGALLLILIIVLIIVLL